MQGYTTFMLAVASLALVMAMLELNMAAGDRDFSRAVAVERAYGVQMNAKEAVLEAAGQGGMEGFAAYDGTHSLRACGACLDHGCAATASCDMAACMSCFREGEARRAAEQGAAEAVARLAAHGFGPDFTVSVEGFACSARLRAEPSARNLLALDSLALSRRLSLPVRSDKLGISAEAYLPEGVAIGHG